ncbi:MAG: ornithine cyclodeaminase family protein [Actinomycetota bacterium]
MPRLLVITDQQVSELLPMKEAIDAVEQAFLDFAEDRAKMPAKIYLEFPKFEGDLRVMPASVGDEFAGVKLVNSHAKNPSRGLPTVVGTYLLFSQETGMPLALIAGTALTAIRTGAGAAVATKWLAPKGSSTLGLVGTGVQARYQLMAINEVLELKTVRAWAPQQDTARRDAFIADMKQLYPGLEIVPAETVEEAVDVDVICTTTPSHTPIVPDLSIKHSTHINAVGADAPGKQELDSNLLGRARVIVDELHQSVTGGEINVPIARGEYDAGQIIGSLGDVIAGNVWGRSADAQITIFDSTGLAIQDIAAATVVYRKSLDSHTGSTIEL